MSAAEGQAENQIETACQGLSKSKEEREMSLGMRVTGMTKRLSKDFKTKTGVRLLVGLTLGCLLTPGVMAAFSGSEGVSHPLVKQQNQAYQAPPAQVFIYTGAGYAELRGPLSNEQVQRIEGYEAFGIPWHLDGHGKVIEVPQKPISTAMSANEQFERWFQDDPNVPMYIYDLLKHGNAVSPSRAVDYSLVDWEEMSLDLAER